MDWIPFKKESLPPVGAMVLLVYQSGFKGAIEFFRNEIDKERYIKGMEYVQKYPDTDYGIIGNMLKGLDNDPILWWMEFPKHPELYELE